MTDSGEGLSYNRGSVPVPAPWQTGLMPPTLLDREEYIEQAYFFRVFRQRIEENLSSQEVLAGLSEEILATTNLPKAIGVMRGELRQTGRFSSGMAYLPHYFTPFQTFVMSRAEDDQSRFDSRIALEILEKEAEYRAGTAEPPALFMYQFECVARNRLGYDHGMQAVAADPLYNDDWRDWICKLPRLLGAHDFAELIYRRSQHRVDEHRRRTNQPDYEPTSSVLFGPQEGRIARAHVGKDPLYMFAALQRQLGYPRVPRPTPTRTTPLFDPAVEMRFQRLEARLALLEQEAKGGLDLTKLLPNADFKPLDANPPPRGTW